MRDVSIPAHIQKEVFHLRARYTNLRVSWWIRWTLSCFVMSSRYIYARVFLQMLSHQRDRENHSSISRAGETATLQTYVLLPICGLNMCSLRLWRQQTAGSFQRPAGALWVAAFRFDRRPFACRITFFFFSAQSNFLEFVTLKIWKYIHSVHKLLLCIGPLVWEIRIECNGSNQPRHI